MQVEQKKNLPHQYKKNGGTEKNVKVLDTHDTHDLEGE